MMKMIVICRRSVGERISLKEIEDLLSVVSETVTNGKSTGEKISLGEIDN